MTRVDFYLLPAGSTAASTVTMLCEKAVAAGNKVYVRAPDSGIAGAVDDLLWTQRQGGFIPHERYVGTPIEEPLPPVLIGALEPPESHRGVLVNLGDDVPGWFSASERVLEVVPGDEQARTSSRERFRWYRERGYPLSTFEQSAEGGWRQR